MSIVAKKIMMGSGAVGDPVDDQFNRVSFLSHFDGANNGVNNIFDDGSTSNHTMTVYGDATQGSFGPFARPDGEWGVALDGSGDYLSIASSADFALGTGDFTVEFFVYHAALPSATTYFDYRNTSNQATLYLWQAGATGAFNLRIDGVNHAFTPPSMLGRWAHIAISRSSSTTKLFVDGTQFLSFSDSTNYVQGTTFTISKFYNGNENVNGAISQFRWIKGTAVYTSAFTTPTSKLTAITNTKLLTCQSNRFVDNSASAHTITPTGNTAVTAFGPFLTSSVYSAGTNGASGYFSSNDSGFTDGTADLLDLGVDADFNFGTGDFSIEYWAYFQGTGGVVFAAHTSGDASGFYNFDNPPRFELFNGGGQVSTGETPPKNSWYHFVLSRQSGTLRVFANGVLKASATNTGSISQDGKRFCVGGILSVSGSNARNYGLKGYLSDFRVVKGSCAAAYQTSSTTNGAVIFTPPTAPLTAITNTKLLLSMADGQAIDSAAQHNLTLAGNANTSTDQAKFGTASLHLDGTGDYAEVASNIGDWNTGNFTVEGWYYLTAQAQYDNLFDFRTSGNTSHLDIYFDDDPLRLHVFFGGADRINANAATPTNEWVHIAVVRNGSTTTLYQNGTSLGTSTTVTTFTEGALRIGNRYSGDYYMQGYVDEFRISRGVARYTANFTAPSEPFADKGQ